MKRFLLIAAFALCWTQVSAQILYVPSGEHGSIQSAIDDASDGDTVVASAGIYQENINFLGKAITVRSVDPNDPNVVAGTIIDGNTPADSNFGSVVTFNSGEDTNSVLSGFTITGGTGSWILVSWEFKGLLWNRCGGGVLCCNMSAPTISKNVFTGNAAGQGGGVYVYGDPVDPNNPSNPPVHICPVIIGNTFTNNTASGAHGFPPPDTNYPNGDHGDGGAIVAFQGVDATIKGNFIQNNHADYYGGGIHLRQWSNGEISDNQILNNNSTLGAGIHITYTSSPLVADNLVKSNTSAGGGGGIYVYYYSDPVIERNFIAQNCSWYSAGIGVYWDSEPSICDNILVNNTGLAILCNTDGTAIVTGNTISDNYEYPKHSNGGITCRAGSTQIIEHNIITSNAGGFGISSDANTIPRYNNVWGNGKGNYSAAIGDQTGINGNISVAPNFVAADNNDYHLNYNSRCINAGDPNFAPAPNETDYDGDQRLLGQYVDIGADEAWPVWNITKGTQYENIQQDINDANDYDIIIVTIGTHTGPGNRNIDFGGKAVTLRSIDPNNRDIAAATIIDCQGSGRGFRFHSGEDTNSIIYGLTITNGYTGFDGGAIYCFNSSPTIRNCIITNNAPHHGHGGGIYCGPGSNAIITNCIISSNTFVTPDGYGGGIYCYKSSPIITNCIITGNSAVGHGNHGGGICCWGDQYAGADAIVANCIVSGNSADHRGGGLYAYWSSPTFINCTVIGNKAKEGGGICSFSRDYIPERVANPTLINCILRNNRAPLGAEGALINTIRVWPSAEHTEMTISCCDVEGGQDAIFVDTNCVLHWGDGNIDLDPNFVDAGCWDDANTPADPNDDFFVTGNYHLLPISACIDAGDNSSVPSVSTADIDGEQRIFNDTVDMGADELVKNPADFDTDGIVDYFDLQILTNEWLSSGGQLQSDLFDDDFIDFADYALFAEQWLWKAPWYE